MNTILVVGFIIVVVIFVSYRKKNKDVKELALDNTTEALKTKTYLYDKNVNSTYEVYNSKKDIEYYEKPKEKVFSDLEELKKHILSFNDSIFKGKTYGLSQRDDGNISFKLSDKNKPKDSVGVFIDFNLFKKNDLTKNIKSNSLKLNFVINHKDIYDKLKKRSISISDYPEIRSTYIKTPLKTFQGEVFIENIKELEKILNICSN